MALLLGALPAGFYDANEIINDLPDALLHQMAVDIQSLHARAQTKQVSVLPFSDYQQQAPPYLSDSQLRSAVNALYFVFLRIAPTLSNVENRVTVAKSLVRESDISKQAVSTVVHAWTERATSAPAMLNPLVLPQLTSTGWRLGVTLDASTPSNAVSEPTTQTHSQPLAPFVQFRFTLDELGSAPQQLVEMPLSSYQSFSKIRGVHHRMEIV